MSKESVQRFLEVHEAITKLIEEEKQTNNGAGELCMQLKQDKITDAKFLENSRYILENLKRNIDEQMLLIRTLESLGDPHTSQQGDARNVIPEVSSEQRPIEAMSTGITTGSSSKPQSEIPDSMEGQIEDDSGPSGNTTDPSGHKSIEGQIEDDSGLSGNKTDPSGHKSLESNIPDGSVQKQNNPSGTDMDDAASALSKLTIAENPSADAPNVSGQKDKGKPFSFFKYKRHKTKPNEKKHDPGSERPDKT